LPNWWDEAPPWEHREVRRHYDPDTHSLQSSFLSKSIDFNECLQQRRAGKPLEYILKHCHIGKYTLKTDSRALIPRPETETLVRMVMKRISDRPPPGPIIDCGTGSGFIAGMLSSSTNRAIVASDVEPSALTLAHENRSLNNWNYSLVCMDRLSGVRDYSAVVANLPYVNRDSPRLTSSVRRYEPSSALYPYEDRTRFYERFLKQAGRGLVSNGRVWMEIDPMLMDGLNNIIDTLHRIETVEVSSDMNSVTRFLELRKR